MSPERLLACAPLLLVACADPEVPLVTSCRADAYSCSGSVALRCAADGAGWVVDVDCRSLGLSCTSQGCRSCEPGGLSCQGLNLVRCRDDGAGFLPTPVQGCDASKGMICDGSGCTNACALARANRSYVGCEYWAVDLDNAVVDIGNAAAQQFAVVLSNPSPLPAQVRILVSEAGQQKEVAARTVAPGALEAILLPPREVDGSPPGQFNAGGGTALTPGAYKIESTAPIVAYQFNPLANAGVFSNDASLLIPTSALAADAKSETGASYLVLGWPQTIATTSDPRTNFGIDLRAFLTIVATRSSTQVKVRLGADIVGDSAGRVPARKRGETLELTLEPFDVLNLETAGFGADFSGTRVEASRPVAVFSGAEAADVPDFLDLSERRCCADHLEEQLFPLPTLGTTFIALASASRSQALKDAGATIVARAEADYFRLLGAGELSSVRTSLPPPLDQLAVSGSKPLQLRSERDFTVQSAEPLIVGQFLASQEDAGISPALPGGDPSFILLPPVEQFRKEYLFLTPDKYAFDFIAVATPAGNKITLDGRPLVDGWSPGLGMKLRCTRSAVGKLRRPGDKHDTEFEAVKCQLSFPKVLPDKSPPDNLARGEQDDGVHRLVAEQPVGLVVYGFDAFVSYGYPGGTDLALINLK
jgi:hypothetical protein